VVSAVSAAIATSVTRVIGPQRRIATVDCAVVNRSTIAMPRLKCLSALASFKCRLAIWVNHYAANWLRNHRHVPLALLSYMTTRTRERAARG
jgi:hypothetical protein